MGKTYSVSLDIYTDSMDLPALAVLCRCSPSPGSHSKGEISASGRPWRKTRLRITSGSDGDAAVEVHLQSILETIESEPVSQAVTTAACEIVIDIGVFFDTPMASTPIPYALLERFRLPIHSVEVTAYPSTMGEEE